MKHFIYIFIKRDRLEHFNYNNILVKYFISKFNIKKYLKEISKRILKI